MQTREANLRQIVGQLRYIKLSKSVASDILTVKRSAMKPDLFANLMLISVTLDLT